MAGITVDALIDSIIVYGCAAVGGVVAYFALYRYVGLGFIESVCIGTLGAIVLILLLDTLHHRISPPKKNVDPLGEEIEWYK